jgi:hypothetical protein
MATETGVLDAEIDSLFHQNSSLSDAKLQRLQPTQSAKKTLNNDNNLAI